MTYSSLVLCDSNSSLTFHCLNFDISAICAYAPHLFFSQSISQTSLLFIHNLCLNAPTAGFFFFWFVLMLIFYPPSWTVWEGIFFSKVKLGWIWHLTCAANRLHFLAHALSYYFPNKYFHFVSFILRSTELPNILWLLRKGTFQKASGFKYAVPFVFAI